MANTYDHRPQDQRCIEREDHVQDLGVPVDETKKYKTKKIKHTINQFNESVVVVLINATGFNKSCFLMSHFYDASSELSLLFILFHPFLSHN